MRHFRPVLVCLTALAALACSAAADAAAGPKHGYYIDPKLQVYLVTNASVTGLTSFQGPCMVKLTSGALGQNGGFKLTVPVKLNGSGGFSYTGKAKFTSDRTYNVTVALTGTFANGRYVGTMKITTPGFTCVPATFHATYYGVNPQG